MCLLSKSAKPATVFIGNPGTGKSSLINCYLKTKLFHSGVSSNGVGVTFQLDKKEFQGRQWMDTPGLADIKLRKAAAAAIDETLRTGGDFQVVFVLKLDGGRIRADDLTTIYLVLEAAGEQITEDSYAILFNQVPRKVLKKMDRDDFLANLTDSLCSRKCPTTKHVHFNMYNEDMDGEDDVICDLDKPTSSFIAECPTISIDNTLVKDVNADAFDEIMAQNESLLNQLQASNAAAEAAETRRQQAEQAKATAEAAKSAAEADKEAAKAEAQRAEREKEAARRQKEAAEAEAQRAEREKEAANKDRRQAEERAEADRLAKLQAEERAEKAQEALEEAQRCGRASLVDGGTYKIRNQKRGGVLYTSQETSKEGCSETRLETRFNYENNGKERFTLHHIRENLWQLRSCSKYNPGSILYCGDTWYGDSHMLSGDNGHGYSYNSGEKGLWRIEGQADGTFKIINAKWGGPLYCGDGCDDYGNHIIWIDGCAAYENNGKERWMFEPA